MQLTDWMEKNNFCFSLRFLPLVRSTSCQKRCKEANCEKLLGCELTCASSSIIWMHAHAFNALYVTVCVRKQLQRMHYNFLCMCVRQLTKKAFSGSDWQQDWGRTDSTHTGRHAHANRCRFQRYSHTKTQLLSSTESVVITVGNR